MSEALCGPSNAFQNLQKHTSADRTLQQKRIVSSRRLEQGFRTNSQASGALDAEFHAFQAPRIPNVPLQRAQLPLAHITPYSTLPLNVHPDWASDFQKLNISDSRIPLPQAQQIHNSQDLIQGGWHTEFMSQKNSTPQRMDIPQTMLQPQYQGFESYVTGDVYASGPQRMLPEQVIQSDIQFDDAAFAHAFDQATAEIEKNSENKGKEKSPETFDMNFACTDPGDVMGEYEFDATQLGLTQESTIPTSDSDQQGSDTVLDRQSITPEAGLLRIGADAILAKSESEALNPQVEADELSRTAGHLLDTLKDEKNAKFQQSSFLTLMRQLRDREVKVDGDKMVPVSDFNSQGRTSS